MCLDDSDDESMKTACDEDFDSRICSPPRPSTPSHRYVNIGTQTEEFSSGDSLGGDNYSTSNEGSTEDLSNASEALSGKYYPKREPGPQCSECLLVCTNCFDSLCEVM